MLFYTGEQLRETAVHFYICVIWHQAQNTNTVGALCITRETSLSLIKIVSNDQHIDFFSK